MTEMVIVLHFLLAATLCVGVALAFVATWLIATKQYDGFIAKLQTSLRLGKETSLISVYVDQYQGEGKPTLVRLISGQRSLDTRMWQSSVTMKIGELLTVELFEDSTFGTFGPRFMGRATLQRNDIETSCDLESLKSGKWIKIEKNGHAIGSLKLEVRMVMAHATSTSDDEAKDGLLNANEIKADAAEEAMRHNAEQNKSKSSIGAPGHLKCESDEDVESADSMQPPPDCDELWQQAKPQEEHLAPPPGYEPWHDDGGDGLSEEGAEWDDDSDGEGGPPGFGSGVSPSWTDAMDAEYERDSEMSMSAKTRLTSTMPKLDLCFLSESLEGLLLKTSMKRAASRFLKNSMWQQRYFKVYREPVDDEWMLGYWKSKAIMSSGQADPKSIAIRNITDVNIVRSHHRDQFVIHFRLEDGAPKQMHLRVVDRSREDWLEKLDLFIFECKNQVATEEEL
eukprot:GEMP01019324.1.p1 GENE.GEMP01019324.1~~GEMP01019324.1.p1  ORF type:complete len:452 (+),score=118.55 GEMP01019324.1:190-1545(+)